MLANEDLDKLLENLPLFIQEQLNDHPNKDKLIEIVMDLGRRPEARFTTGPEYLSQKIISWQDIEYTTKRISKFSNDNRAGIERTLHRISCIRNRRFVITGLTCRIGRAIFGTISSIRDLLDAEQSILLLGKPGVGKTTIIREIARVLSDEMEKRVIIVDTSNEIAGDSDVAHSGIGRARRMQVSKTELQHQIMIEAVENHMPQVIIIDEISTELEALAARTIAEKGVQLIGTTHGNCLENLIKNPSLADLIGGIQYVTLSDDEAKRRGTQKSILERKASPAFQVVIEINEPTSWTIHENVEESIDLLLRGNLNISQVRNLTSNSKTNIKYKNFPTNSFLLIKQLGRNKNSLPVTTNSWITLTKKKQIVFKELKGKKLVIYLYSLSTNLVQELMNKVPIDFVLTNELYNASIILGSRTHLSQNKKLLELAKQNNILVYFVEPSNIMFVLKLLT
jgi:stage III sporulation protein SpoIIIAA